MGGWEEGHQEKFGESSDHNYSQSLSQRGKERWVSPPTLWCSLRKFCNRVEWSRNHWKARDLNSGRRPPNPAESALPLARKGSGEGRVLRWQIKAASLLRREGLPRAEKLPGPEASVNTV